MHCWKRRKSILVSEKDTVINEDKILIAGKSFSKRDKEPIGRAYIKIDSKDKNLTQITDSLGYFKFQVPKDDYKMTIQFIGYNDFEYEVLSKSCILEVELGRADAFVTYGIKSKRRLTKFQLRHKVEKEIKEWINKNQALTISLQ